MGRQEGESESLITFVRDRPGHDHRYAIDSAKAERVLGWRPSRSFESALEEVIRWYLTNSGWLQNVTSGAYRDYYRKHYNRD
jgi:dTDP-glucose 4,6-dehydratase